VTSDVESEASREDAERLLADVLTGNSGSDPYGAYRWIREQAPVLCTRNGTVVLTRFDDVWAALRHPDLGKPEQGFGIRRGEVPGDQASQAMARWKSTILFANPPEHTRLRRLLSDVFTPRHVEQLRSQIAAIADRHLDRLDGQPGTDFIDAVALPLPAQVIADLLGIPGTDYQDCAPLVRDLVDLFEPFATAASVARAITAQDKISGYLAGLLAAKRRHPGPDLLSRLAASRAADALDDTEMTATAVLLFAAGFETTVNLLGNGLHALLTHPAQLTALRQDPALVPRAVEEFLRWDSPVQLTSRSATRPCAIAGAELSPGQTVLVLLGGANRDPARFTDPDEMIVARDEGLALSFGSGIHFCLGAHLARLEAAELFTRLLSRFAHLELAGPPQRRPGRSLRGFAQLPITATR
jgi:cytochrome P450